MAETDFLALIEQGAEPWNRWRADHPTVQPDLRKAYLFGQVLAGFNLSGVDLGRACLISADLRGANLSKARLQAVYASKADLSEADLREADLSRGNFGEADFSGAILTDIRANGANFAQACFTGASLANWQIDQTIALQALRGSHLYVNKQRKPSSGEFRPGELAALIKRSSVEAAEMAEAAKAKPSLFISPQKFIKGPAQRRSVQIGAGVTAAIALTALAATLGSNRQNTLSANPPPDRAVRPEESISLPCKEAPLTTLTSSAAYQYRNGALYYGKFIEGKPADGRGTMVYPNGNRYDGEYKSGYRNGCGTFTFSNGRRYIGQFEADQFNGQGTWILESGERYIGEFENNRCSGKGTFIFLNGSSKSGVWEDGNLVDGDLSCDQGGLDSPVSSSR